jgi:hypothetical protein
MKRSLITIIIYYTRRFELVKYKQSLYPDCTVQALAK